MRETPAVSSETDSVVVVLDMSEFVNITCTIVSFLKGVITS